MDEIEIDSCCLWNLFIGWMWSSVHSLTLNWITLLLLCHTLCVHRVFMRLICEKWMSLINYRNVWIHLPNLFLALSVSVCVSVVLGCGQAQITVGHHPDYFQSLKELSMGCHMGPLFPILPREQDHVSPDTQITLCLVRFFHLSLFLHWGQCKI